jgi:Transposase DDE domain group 1
MENRIKECQLNPFADRTSAKTMRANQLRLWFAALAYMLVCALRRIALRHTQFAEATCGTIRLKLFKIGALVRVSIRRIKVAMASALSYQNEFALAHSYRRVVLTRKPRPRYVTPVRHGRIARVTPRPGCAPALSLPCRVMLAPPLPIRNRCEKSGLVSPASLAPVSSQNGAPFKLNLVPE